MFVPDYKNSIPGYTGHKPDQLDTGKDIQQPCLPRKQIPGYGGYVPGVKSENVYGQTYGKTSFASSANSFPRGIDQDPNVKFRSVMKGEYIDHAQVQHLHETTAQIVGVDRGEDLYKRPIPPSQIHAFYAASCPDGTLEEQMQNNAAQSDYYATLHAQQEGAGGQAQEGANAAFYGVEVSQPHKEVERFGEPIPGYSGMNRRVQADNVFGMTYAEARRMAGESQNKIDCERKETLKETSKWIPENKRGAQ